MKHADVKVGMTTTVNADGDLYMDAEVRPFIGQEVTVIGMVHDRSFVVQKSGGEQAVIAARNLGPSAFSALPDSEQRMKLTTFDYEVTDADR